eukprot:CAMPEP_0184681784 /NCGR_PEP_ID=MMETSP0312-20130426/4779_1 /TAXON_ID=31354 /ORGANISM="Compsopogon coeruleus, Strain SAG 36.94" /LENGTH=618 /DNA_ID=CAMNT_0027132851 /DNA_START=105 /DNA_END=1961 /DNA_ORIENTATION=-
MDSSLPADGRYDGEKSVGDSAREGSLSAGPELAELSPEERNEQRLQRKRQRERERRAKIRAAQKLRNAQNAAVAAAAAVTTTTPTVTKPVTPPARSPTSTANAVTLVDKAREVMGGFRAGPALGPKPNANQTVSTTPPTANVQSLRSTAGESLTMNAAAPRPTTESIGPASTRLTATTAAPKPIPSPNTIPKPQGGERATWTPGRVGRPPNAEKLSPSPATVNASQAKKIADSLLRESETYRKLVKLEREIDVAIMRKQLALKSVVGPPVINKRRTFRLYIFNTFKDRERKELGARADGVAMWTMRIQGWMMPETDEEEDWTEGRVSCTARCTDVFNRVVIELDPDMYPDDYLIEWNRAEDEPIADGFEVSRPSKGEFIAKIIIFVHYRPEHFRLSEPLKALLGVEAESSNSVFASMWKYIKNNRLYGSDDKTMIRLDAGLRSLLPSSAMTVDKLKMSSMFEVVKSHLLPMEPIELKYRIQLSGDPGGQQSCFDLYIPWEDGFVRSGAWTEVSTILSSSKLPDNPALNGFLEKHLEALEQLGVHRRRKEFFERFAADPARFINQMILSQTRDLRAMAGNSSRPHDEERKSSFYQQQWVNEAVPRYLLKKVIGKAPEKR